ncbi:MAG TPA: hypothetical protein VFU21_12565, partial [Kofleriaceae bacterium]|nr:hypothetical protein [Kofleriaceae bacterium]
MAGGHGEGGRRLIAGALAIALAACGGSSPGEADAAGGADDARPADAGPEPPYLGPVHQLGLLPPLDGLEYNHSNEVQLAVSGDRVAVAYLNLHFVSADDFAVDDTFIRTLGVAVSEDGGASYDPPAAAPLGRQPTDPNLRVDPEGSFWLGTFDFDTISSGGQGLIARSDDARSWTPVVEGEDFGDKNWMAIDPESGEVFVAAIAGWWRIAGGAITRDATDAGQLVGGYARGGTAAFIATSGQVLRWDGETAPTSEPPPAPVGATFFHTVSMPLGATADGGEWFLRPTGDTTAAPLMLHHAPAAGAASDVPLTAADAITFLPAADLDDQRRLHVVYYESSGTAGRLLYTHSLSSDLAGGFSDPLVIDPEATPALFFPDIDTPSGARRR